MSKVQPIIFKIIELMVYYFLSLLILLHFGMCLSATASENLKILSMMKVLMLLNMNPPTSSYNMGTSDVSMGGGGGRSALGHISLGFLGCSQC